MHCGLVKRCWGVGLAQREYFGGAAKFFELRCGDSEGVLDLAIGVREVELCETVTGADMSGGGEALAIHMWFLRS